MVDRVVAGPSTRSTILMWEVEVALLLLLELVAVLPEPVMEMGALLEVLLLVTAGAPLPVAVVLVEPM